MLQDYMGFSVSSLCWADFQKILIQLTQLVALTFITVVLKVLFLWVIIQMMNYYVLLRRYGLLPDANVA